MKVSRQRIVESGDGGQLPWSYARTARLSALLRERETALAAEVNDAAGLAWGVRQTVPFMFTGEEPALDEQGLVVAAPQAGSFKLVGRRRASNSPLAPTFYVNVRDDIDEVIGIVKGRYRIVQNAQAPAVVDRLVTAGEARYEAAGALHGGAQVWWLARLLARAGGGAGDDDLQLYVLLTNSHDGSTAVTVSCLAVHVGIKATIAWPLPQAPRTLTLRHTDSAKERALDGERVRELVAGYHAELFEVVEQLRQTAMTQRQFERFIDGLVPTPRPAHKRDGRVKNQRGITMAETTKELISLLYSRNEGLASVRDTLLGAVLACQLYSDNLTINRNTDDATAAENRFKRLTSDTNLGCMAFRRALELLP